MICPKTRKANSQRGVALLIAIFALLLISGVAISLIVMSGTESSLAANYKRNTSAFYAAQAGIEEGRARLTPCFPLPDNLWQRPPASAVDACNNPQQSTDPLFTLNPATVVGPPFYIRNGVALADIINPKNPSWDWQYTAATNTGGEGGTAANQAAAQTAVSSALMAPPGWPALNYKWVRINLKSEAMGGVDLDEGGISPDPTPNTTLPLYVSSKGAQCVSTTPGCIYDPNAVTTISAVYRVTALAIDPTGSQRMLQAEVALPPIINPNGAVSSEAGVTVRGSFGAFGSYPPIVSTKCGTKTIDTCGSYDAKGSLIGDCTQPYNPGPPPTCGGKPMPSQDYCGQGRANNAVASAGSITPTSATTNLVPDKNTSCTTGGQACLATTAPQQARDQNVPNWPYNMDQIINAYKPASTPIESYPGIACTSIVGGKDCTGSSSSIQLGTLPSPFPPPPNTPTTNAVPAIVYADTGTAGYVKLTGGASGAGILVVEGDLYLGGGFQWYGLIVVHGTVTFLGGGSTANIIGGVLAGQDVNAGLLTTLGGSTNIIFDSCAYRNLAGQDALRLLAFREIKKP